MVEQQASHLHRTARGSQVERGFPVPVPRLDRNALVQ
jgi:hypothetical protein